MLDKHYITKHAYNVSLIKCSRTGLPFKSLNFIYFTRITKQVILIMFIGLRSDGLRVGGNRSARLTCRRLVSNPGRSGERRVR